MMEARVKCLCPDYRLAELGLVLHFGDVVYVPADKARLSTELQLAEKVRAVEVRWGSRCEVSKSPVPPWLKRKNRTFTTPEPTPVNHEDLERRAKEAARQEVGETIRDVVREEIQAALRSAGVSGQAPVDTSAIVDAVRSALAGVTVPQSRPQKSAATSEVSEAEPVFIPTGIVPTETKGAIEVPSETTSGADVADSSAALKAARGRTRKKQE